MTVDSLAPEEQLSPELVLVLPPQLRAEALARLPQPDWRKARERVAVTPPRTPEPLTRIATAVLLAHVVQLVLITVSVTVAILTLAAVANAVR